jgi:hypothetical protein
MHGILDLSSPSNQLLFNTIRLETRSLEGKVKVGTSFVMNFEYEGGNIDLLVTNKHVVKDAEEGFLWFTTKENDAPKVGSYHILRIEREFGEHWVGHPDINIDVAVFPIQAAIHQILSPKGIVPFYVTLPMNVLVKDEELQEMDALEEILFVGYPSGLWDQKNNTPILRRGTTATPIFFDFNGRKMFLVDASVFPGSSGSPVFLYNTGSYLLKKKKQVVMGNRIRLLGILAKVMNTSLSDNTEITTELDCVGEKESKERIDLGVVYKTSTILETAAVFMKKHDLPDLKPFECAV